MPDHIVMFSGGAGSWAAAKRVVEDYGPENVKLVFADTMMEDEDLYRFLHEAVENVQAELVYLQEGRDVWQVFKDKRFIGNTRVDPCSRILKRELIFSWLEETYSDPSDVIIYLGMDWTEGDRFKKAQSYWTPYIVQAPMKEPPYLDKDEVLEWMKSEGLEPPRLYNMGFPHNNCGGFCIKAGQGHFKLLLEKLPERYAYHERKEQEMRDYLGKDVAILRDRRNGQTKPMTLKTFRERVEQKDSSIDKDEFGGCGCFTPEESETVIHLHQ